MTDNPKRVKQIIDKHVHAVRNSINGLDLATSLVEELSKEPAASRPLAIMRTELKKLEETMNALHLKFTEPRKSTITSHDFLKLWQNKIAPLENARHQITWLPSPAPKTMSVDVNAILSVLQELLVAGWALSPNDHLQAAVIATDTSVIAEVRESNPQAPRDAHDMEEARRLVEMSGGTLDTNVDQASGERVVTLTFAAGD